MEASVWQLIISAAAGAAKSGSDYLMLLAYFVLMLCRLKSQPMMISILLCSVMYVITAIYPAYVFWLFCAIVCSYATIFYYDNNSRAWTGSALMTVLMAIMGMENVLAWLGWEFIFNALYDSYEICLTGIHILIICQLINWRRVLRFMGEFVDNLRNGQSRANMLFILV